MLREQLQKHDQIRLLTYCITANHVHLLVTSRSDESSVSGLMQALQGQYAQEYNRQKERSGAFWGDRFHATMIDGGEYLAQCMRYIDLNMVRAGVVRHPSQWRWCGYNEIVGIRKRYRIVDLDELTRRTHQTEPSAVSAWYAGWLDGSTGTVTTTRDERWTDSIAVGSRAFVEELGRQSTYRMNVEVIQDGNRWCARETAAAYSHCEGP